MLSTLSTGFASVVCGGGGARRVWSWRVGRWLWILPTIALPQECCVSSVTLNCSVANIVKKSGSQLFECLIVLHMS